MDVILLQRVAKLGQMGETVRVKNGYARNFLLPTGKALRATEANKRRFQDQKADLEARNLHEKSEASAVAENRMLSRRDIFIAILPTLVARHAACRNMASRELEAIQVPYCISC